MSIYRFDCFELNGETLDLRQDDQKIPIRPKTAELLVFFLEHSGELVTKQQLSDAVWGDISVSQAVVFQTISDLRKTLGDNPRTATYIANIKKRGYRWLASVEKEEDVTEQTPTETVAGRRLSGGGVLVAIFVLLLGVALFWRGTGVSEPIRLALIIMDNPSSEDFEGRELADMVTTVLNSSSDLEVISPGEVWPLAAESRALEPRQRAKRLCEMMGLDLVVFLRTGLLGAEIHLTYQIFDPDGWVGQEVIVDNNLLGVADRLSMSLAGYLKVMENFRNVSQTFSPDPSVVHAYAAGQHALRFGHNVEARNRFGATLAIDPDFLWGKIGLAQCSERMGRLEEAELLTQEVMEQNESSKRPGLLRLCLATRSFITGRLGDYESALAYRRRVVELAARDNDALAEADALLNLSATLIDLRRAAEAEKAIAECRKIYMEQGYQPGLAHAFHNLGRVYFDKERYNEAEPYFEYALEIYQTMGSNWFASTALVNLGTLAQKRGDPRGGCDRLLQGIDAGRKSGNYDMVMTALNNLGARALNDGDQQEALSWFEEALAISGRTHARDVELSLFYNLVNIYSSKGDVMSAEPLMDHLMLNLGDHDPTIHYFAAYLAHLKSDHLSAVDSMEAAKVLAGKNWSEQFERVLAEYRAAVK